MLRIRRHDVIVHRVVLVLQGFIVAESADHLERECAELVRSGLPVALDLSGVSFVGASGVDALRRVQSAGVRIVSCSPLVAWTLEDAGIEVEGSFTQWGKENREGDRGFN